MEIEIPADVCSFPVIAGLSQTSGGGLHPGGEFLYGLRNLREAVQKFIKVDTVKAVINNQVVKKLQLGSGPDMDGGEDVNLVAHRFTP